MEGTTILELDNPKATLRLQHGHHLLPHYHSKTTFTYEGKEYCWEGHSELYRKDIGEDVLIANFYPVFDAPGIIGTVEVVRDGEELSEVVMVTCMIILKRVELQAETMNSR